MHAIEMSGAAKTQKKLVCVTLQSTEKKKKTKIIPSKYNINSTSINIPSLFTCKQSQVKQIIKIILKNLTIFKVH